MILFVQKALIGKLPGYALIPTTEGSVDLIINKLPSEKELRADVTQPRNLAHHKKYWALCAVVAEATDITPEEVSDILKLRTGHFELEAIEDEEGKWKTVARLKSIAFHRMDQLKFSDFFERCVAVIYERWYGRANGHNSGKFLKEKIDELLSPTTEKRG